MLALSFAVLFCWYILQKSLHTSSRSRFNKLRRNRLNLYFRWEIILIQLNLLRKHDDKIRDTWSKTSHKLSLYQQISNWLAANKQLAGSIYATCWQQISNSLAANEQLANMKRASCWQQTLNSLAVTNNRSSTLDIFTKPWDIQLSNCQKIFPKTWFYYICWRNVQTSVKPKCWLGDFSLIVVWRSLTPCKIVTFCPNLWNCGLVVGRKHFQNLFLQIKSQTTNKSWLGSFKIAVFLNRA